MWDEGSMLRGIKELVVTIFLPAAAIGSIFYHPWTAVAIVPAFLVWVWVHEVEDRRRWKEYHEACRRKEAEDEKNRELGEKMYEHWLKSGGGK
jgi:heme exporter protein D